MTKKRLGKEISRTEFDVALAVGCTIGKDVTWTDTVSYSRWLQTTGSDLRPYFFMRYPPPNVPSQYAPPPLVYFLLEGCCEGGHDDA